MKAKLKKLKSLEIDWASYCKSRKERSQKPQIIRNSLGASVKAKMLRSLEIDWGQLLQINESKTQKPQIIRNGLQPSMNAKVQNLRIVGNRFSHLLQINETKNLKISNHQKHIRTGHEGKKAQRYDPGICMSVKDYDLERVRSSFFSPLNSLPPL